jgi:guanylate kinase
VITRRLLAAGSDRSRTEFDYVIINEDLDLALSQMIAIVTATRLRFATQAARHHDLFAQLGSRARNQAPAAARSPGPAPAR